MNILAEKLPQNIVSLVGEVGEKQVLLRLAFFVHQNKQWQVFYNLGRSGYDILLRNNLKNKEIHIEVKTHQNIFTTSKRRGRVLFLTTKKEYDSCDYVIACYLDNNQFFIIPKKELKPAQNGKRYRFLITFNKKGEPHPRFRKYLDNWKQLFITKK
jgi:hypothetical protein